MNILDGFLKRSKTKIVGPDGKPVYLRGVNFGGWLMREAYMHHSPNFPEKHFRKVFTDALGVKAWEEWDQAFSDHFVRESDFQQIADWGFNSIRIPFHHRVVETKPFHYDRKGLDRLKKAVQWAKKYGVYVILDLHGAAGGQNLDWHSDSYGKAELWTKKVNRERTFALWEFLADQFKDEPTIAGYDLLNETVIEDVRILETFYQQLIKRIRAVDKNHLLFAEAIRWAIFPEGLEEIYQQPGTVLSIHSYEPMNVTFNLVHNEAYPSDKSNKDTLRAHYEKYQRFSQKHSVPVHVGEFGINYRQGLYGEDVWLRDVLAHFAEFGFHWNYWTYKAVKGSAFPDGILSYYPNPPWVNRLGPLMGWNTYHFHWNDKKKDMIRSWQTDEFTLNKPVLDRLRHAVKNHKFR